MFNNFTAPFPKCFTCKSSNNKIGMHAIKSKNSTNKVIRRLIVEVNIYWEGLQGWNRSRLYILMCRRILKVGVKGNMQEKQIKKEKRKKKAKTRKQFPTP